MRCFYARRRSGAASAMGYPFAERDARQCLPRQGERRPLPPPVISSGTRRHRSRRRRYRPRCPPGRRSNRARHRLAIGRKLGRRQPERPRRWPSCRRRRSILPIHRRLIPGRRIPRGRRRLVRRRGYASRQQRRPMVMTGPDIAIGHDRRSWPRPCTYARRVIGLPGRRDPLFHRLFPGDLPRQSAAARRNGHEMIVHVPDGASEHEDQP